MNFFQWMDGRSAKFLTNLVWLNHEDWRREETASKRSSFVGIERWWFFTEVSCRRSNVGIQLVSRANSWIRLAVKARFLVCGQLDREEKKEILWITLFSAISPYANRTIRCISDDRQTRWKKLHESSIVSLELLYRVEDLTAKICQYIVRLQSSKR